jgi:hypothetical protein
VIILQTSIQETTNLEAVIISSESPNQNFYGGDLVLNNSMLLIKQGFDINDVYVSEFLINLSLAGTYESRQFLIGKIQSPWDINTVTYNNRPQIGTARGVYFGGGNALGIDATAEANGYGIALWGGNITVAMISQVLSTIPTSIILPTTVAASKKVDITCKPFKTDYFVRKIVITRNDVEVFSRNGLGEVKYTDEQMDYNQSYVYKLYVTLS